MLEFSSTVLPASPSPLPCSRHHLSYNDWRITTTTTVLRPFFQDHLGELVSKENLWTLWCKGRLTEADTPNIWLGATQSGLSSAHLHQRKNYQNCSVLCCVQQWCTMICTHIWAVLEDECWFRFRSVFVHFSRFSILYVFLSYTVFTRGDRRGDHRGDRVYVYTVRSPRRSHRVNIHATGRAIDRGDRSRDRSLRRSHRVNKHATDRGDQSRDRSPRRSHRVNTPLVVLQGVARALIVSDSWSLFLAADTNSNSLQCFERQKEYPICKNTCFNCPQKFYFGVISGPISIHLRREGR